jgi:hypothetical protein
MLLTARRNVGHTMGLPSGCSNLGASVAPRRVVQKRSPTRQLRRPTFHYASSPLPLQLGSQSAGILVRQSFALGPLEDALRLRAGRNFS